MDWQNLLKQVAPWVAAAATGNVPAMLSMAATQIGGVLGKDIKPTTDAIAAAVSGATPEQLLALKTADNDFAMKMQQLGFDNVEHLEAIAAGDRDSARKREIATHDWTPRAISIIWLIVTAVCEGSLLSGWEPHVAPELVGRILGTLDTGTMMVFAYYLGSNVMSGRKTELIAQGTRP